MEYEHFGILLKELRLKHNMSREKLAENICTPKQIYRIEKGESEPSVHLLYQLSLIFHIDLNEYYKMHFRSYTIAGLEGIREINIALMTNDIKLLRGLVNQYEKLETFQRGEPLQHIIYGKSICSALLDENYELSLQYSLDGIRVEYPDFCLNNITKRIYSNVGMALLNCMSQSYFSMRQYAKGMKVLKGIITVLETYFQNSLYSIHDSDDFFKKIYQGLLYNIGFHLFKHKDIKQALEYVDKGINFAVEIENMRHLPCLLSLKFMIFYSKQKFREAKEFYEHTIHLYHISENHKKLAEFEEEVSTCYSDILNM